MYAEERGWVPIRNPDRRIQRQHICGHSRLIHPRLYVEAPEHHILPITAQNMALKTQAE